MSRTAMFVVALALVALPGISGMITKIPLPKELYDCYLTKSLNASISETPAKLIQEFCNAKYTLQHMDDPIVYSHNITKEGVKYLDAMFRRLDGEIQEVTKLEKQPRHKRQTTNTWRIRKEFRTLTRAEFQRLVQCFNRLKNDYSIDSSMSTYDLIGSLHTGRAARSMHHGPGFFPRHMLMILIMETACQSPMHYWDMTMDADMVVPTDSIIFSEEFFGNGDGIVRTGPFANWRTTIGTPIIRNIGSGGEALASKQGIRAMLSRSRLVEISEPQVGNAVYSVEVHHNGVHNWIDGHMSRLNTAWFDPMFYGIHSFFTLIWIAFKGLQRNRGIDPQRDYPNGPFVPSGHEYFQRADFRPFLRPLSNLEAMSDTYDRMVTYMPMPRCPSCGNSPYLTCQSHVCVSISRPRFMPNMFMFGRKKRSIQDQGQGNPDPTVSGASLADDSVDNKTANVLQSSETALSTLDLPYQNTFIIDGKTDLNKWAWLNVKILFERPKGFNFHTNVPGQNSSTDMYDTLNFERIAKQIGIHNEINYKKQCSSSGSGAAKVFVQSDGLNYAGRYKDYAIVDERQPIYSSVSYTAVKKPTVGKPTKVLLTAFDTCGRSCRAACPVPGTDGTSYEPCEGAVEVSTEYPLMYSSSYGSAVSAAFSVHLEGKGPMFRVKNNPITFVCDHQNKWPWE